MAGLNEPDVSCFVWAIAMGENVFSMLYFTHFDFAITSKKDQYYDCKNLSGFKSNIGIYCNKS